VIPGARTPEQALANAGAAEVAPLSAQQLDGVRAVYETRVKPHVHDRW
jgi:aryl-alcohol dehydrogenase-like predicted oxidoreductase